MRHAHRLVIRVFEPQPVRDLFRRLPRFQTRNHSCAQHRVRGQLRWFGSLPPAFSIEVGEHRPITITTLMPTNFARHRRHREPDLLADRAERQARTQPSKDVDPVLQRQPMILRASQHERADYPTQTSKHPPHRTRRLTNHRRDLTPRIARHRQPIHLPARLRGQPPMRPLRLLRHHEPPSERPTRTPTRNTQTSILCNHPLKPPALGATQRAFTSRGPVLLRALGWLPGTQNGHRTLRDVVKSVTCQGVKPQLRANFATLRRSAHPRVGSNSVGPATPATVSGTAGRFWACRGNDMIGAHGHRAA